MRRAHVAAAAVATAGITVLLLGAGCSRPNPAFDPLEDGGGSEGEDELGDGSTGADDETKGPDADGGGSDGGAEGGDGGTGDGQGPDADDSDQPLDPAVPDDEGLLLYASFDAFEAPAMPEVGAGPSSVGSLPEVVEGTEGTGLRFTSRSQWLAFPQHDGESINVDHRQGRMEVDVRLEDGGLFPEARELISLSGVEFDGGGIRVGIDGAFGGYRLVVQYIDASGNGDSTRFPAGLLPADEWVHMTLTWSADVEPGEPNIELWIDDDWIEPLSPFASGPKVVGEASPEDVLVIGSWSLGDTITADASFDELAIYDAP
ncbi:MAG: hypothetical protein AB1Z98_26775 [Nannocystaceae bacterium]